MRRLILLCALPAMAAGATEEASNSAAVSGRWLKVPSSARAEAMAGAGSALEGDLQALHANPAGLASVRRSMMQATHNAWLAEISSDHASFGMPLRPGLGIAGGLDYLSYGSIPRVALDASGRLQEQGSLRPFSMQFIAGLGMEFGDLAWGASLKGLVQNLEASQGAVAVDLGAIWRRPASGLALGVSVQHLGGDFGASPLPTALHTALAWQDGKGLLISGEADISPRGDASSVSLGGEYGLGPLALRAGWRQGAGGRASGPTLGLGSSWRDFALDYAYSPDSLLHDAHLVTLRVSFGPAPAP